MGNLNHRMACDKLLSLIKRLDYAQWIAAVETGFGGILKIIEEDVRATLALPMGPLEVPNLGRIGTPKVGKMVEQILHRGDYGEEFKRDYVLYIISTCIIRSVNGDCFFRMLKLLVDVNQIANYNWCVLLLQSMNDTVVSFIWIELSLDERDAMTDVEQCNKDEKEFPRECGRGKTIDKIDYQSINHEDETDLQEELASMA
ncbi:hypothetical protein Cgig2_024535 [Carnegiea gigantea]|uniref:Uncharacterized protein n=1 Tax=Carnegiea gigantea TaxID=171969 RepID=A0A9Q1JXJ1_9CARY|nr:hypothetical protein Cgig2_024535 [Carnegiea gigantea]